MNDDKASEIIRLLDSIDTTLREVCNCVCVGSQHMEAVKRRQAQVAEIEQGFDVAIQQQREAMFAAHAADLQQTLSEPGHRELSEITLTNVVPKTEDDKQRLDKWLEQLDKCQCPIQVHIEHDGCCEHKHAEKTGNDDVATITHDDWREYGDLYARNDEIRAAARRAMNYEHT